MTSKPRLLILGTRGIPARHGGFETFAERLALFAHGNGWDVTVYCQNETGPTGPVIDTWNGIRRVSFCSDSGALGTMKFDWRCTSHAKDQPGVALVLGYNTAVLGILLRAAGKPLFTNMDGIEWKRAKWPFHGRVWLYLNEWLGALSSTRLIADHPEIARHLARRRAARDIVMIPYGADPVLVASDTAVRELGLTPSKYMLSIGRIEPENNILPMIRSFVSRPGKFQFVCIGKLEPENNLYHASVIKAADGRVIFPGAIYEADRVKALRFYAGAYCHGHSVGGTNPSLVEALGSGNVIIAHDNCYNRWVAGDDQFYFSSDADCAAAFDVVEAGGELVEQAKFAARKRFDLAFHWGPILEEYLALMVDCASV